MRTNYRMYRAARPKSKRGFTLIELLVVIAVIAILAAILVPSIAGSIQTARRMACSAKLRSIGGALAMIYSETGNFPPYAGSQYNWLGKKTDWRPLGADERAINLKLGSFLPDQGVDAARCPADKLNGYGTVRPYAVDKSAYDHGGSSYGANINPTTGGLNPGSGTEGLSVEAVKSPSRMVTFADDGVFAAVWWSQSAWDNRPTASNWFWHGKPFHWNLLMMDGHVEYTYVPNQSLIGGTYSFHRDF